MKKLIMMLMMCVLFWANTANYCPIAERDNLKLY